MIRISESRRSLVLVTGGSGLIGSALIRSLGNRYTIIGLDRDSPPHPPINAECVGVDLTSDESVRESLQRVEHGYGTRIASVVHLAAYYDFSGDPSPLYEQVTVRGTQRLLRKLQRFEVGQFIFSSTMLVHAPTQPGRPLNENSPLDPKWDYPKSKIQTEALIAEERGEIAAIILRIAGVYDDRCHSIPIAHQIQRLYERKLIARVFPGDVTHGQAFVHLDDLIAAIEAAIERRDQLPESAVVLIGEDQTMSYDEIQRTLSSLLHGEEQETAQIAKPIAKTGAWLQDVMPGEEPFIKPWMIDLADEHYELDITRAERLLGWRPKRSLRETLPKMVAALREEPLKFYRENKLEPPAWLEKAEPRPEETVRERR